MNPIRIRHSRGTVTINVDLENGTILELQQEIRKVTNILPSLQDVKTGFPPRPVTLISELPISSLGLKGGDQLIISELKPTSTSTAAIPTPAAAPSASSQPANLSQQNPPAPKPAPKFVTSTPTVPTTQTSAPRAPGSSSIPTATVSQPSGGQPDEVETDSGILVHRIVPDDNSCLFSSIGIAFEQDMGAASRLRQVVADAIRKDSINYDDATLGRSREDYMQTILKPSTWGGAIELAIFSEVYQAEISSIDVETGRCDRFGQDKYPNRAILLYSGIHYDAVSLSPVPDAPLDFHTTIFPVSDQSIMDGAAKLADKLRAKKAFTNTSTFDLRCEICRIGLKGEKDAREHAKQTGHTSFGEY